MTLFYVLVYLSWTQLLFFSIREIPPFPPMCVASAPQTLSPLVSTIGYWCYFFQNPIFGPKSVHIKETPLYCDAVQLGECFVPALCPCALCLQLYLNWTQLLFFFY